MCAICGIVNFELHNPVDRHLVKRMTDIQAHRGPDDEGYWFADNAGLGHRRLSIIDLGGGKQPIFNEDGSIGVILNGEIYNYAAITADLVARGHRFRTRSDTEAIVHAYEEYGEGCLEKLRGMFAFALWDSRRRRLFLARDRLGIKPVYYYHGATFLAFASEVKALLEIPEVPRQLDPIALDSYLSLRYVPGPRTMFKDIWKLQPGHFMVVDEHGPRITRYWDIEYREKEPSSLAADLERFEALLEESVRLRLIAEVPLGVFLSGGLDSSAILAIMSKIAGQERIKTFSVGYQSPDGGEEEENEFHYARQAAQAFGAEHHEFRVQPVDFRDFMPSLVWHLDEPLGDPSSIPLYFIAQLARKYITVVLSGEGADEILAGYGIYPRMLALDSVHRGLPECVKYAPRLAARLPWEKVRRYAQLAAMPLEAGYRGVSRAFFPDQKRRLLAGPGGNGFSTELDGIFAAHFGAVSHASPLDRMLYVDAKVWLPDDLLLKADKMTMANALELRVPFLDHKLVGFAAQLAQDRKLRGGTGKYLLRRLMEPILPPSIIRRPKKGFPVPTQKWLRGQLKDFARQALLDSASACRLYLNPQVIEQMIGEHEQGRANRQEEIWSLLVFEFWHKLFLEKKVARPAASAELAEVA